MTDPAEALRLVLKSTRALGAQSVPLAQAVDRVLAADIHARGHLPAFDNAAMDGYAVRAADLAGATPQEPVELRVREVVRAGSAGRFALRSGEAARIMTGAPVPRGADSVVMQELTAPGAKGRVRISKAAESGSHIRPRGEDVRAGSLLLKAGTALRPYEIALLAAQGITRLRVMRRATVAVLATGDELVKRGARPAQGRIYDSNGPALLAALSRWDAPTADLGIVGDDPIQLHRALAGALSRADVVLVTGGVSVGDFDYTRSVIADLGVREVFWKVAIKPGKPLLFGTYGAPGEKRKLIFGLPGNPLASLVCLEEFVRPALEKLQGRALKHQSYHLEGTATNDYPKPKDRQQYLFCRARPGGGGYVLDIIRPQGSSMLGMATGANALAVAPVGLARVPRGMTLAFRWLK